MYNRITQEGKQHNTKGENEMSYLVTLLNGQELDLTLEELTEMLEKGVNLTLVEINDYGMIFWEE